jgi:hypothetical protein
MFNLLLYTVFVFLRGFVTIDFYQCYIKAGEASNISKSAVGKYVYFRKICFGFCVFLKNSILISQLF